MYYENFDLTTVVTPVKVDVFESMLKDSNYNPVEIDFLVSGFRDGFDIGYRGQEQIKQTSPNLKFRVGSPVILRNKIMKEVSLKRYAGPFAEIPYSYYIQSPVSLVPKGADGKDVRLIFHLLYLRKGASLNSETPKHLTSVQYCDFADLIKECMKHEESAKLAKSDMSSAFQNLGLRPKQFYLLILKAESPIDGKTYYFVDKCLPFGAAISCLHFQRFSDAVAHLLRHRTGYKAPNYLDDFLFVAALKLACDTLVRQFLHICGAINFPVSLEKTFWGCSALTFLGLLIDAELQIVAILVDKIERAQDMIQDILGSKNTTVKKIQKLCGFLNFLCRCIVPGRAFTRRLYVQFSPKMAPHHHIRVNREFRQDLVVWQTFLCNPVIYCCPFIGFSEILSAEILEWFMDASGVIGFGGICGTHWFWGEWDPVFLSQKPSIEYQELFAIAVSILLWTADFENKRICLHCDNQVVVHM